MAENTTTEIKNMSLSRLCETGAGLCTLASRQAGAAGYAGGICPENIRVAEDGSVRLLAPQGEKPTDGELDFIAPEVFWKGENSERADIYGIGMVLYYGASRGVLPFENETNPEKARGRRLAGKPFRAPKKAGEYLGTIIEKATAYKPEDRYQSLGELKEALEGCPDDIDEAAAAAEVPDEEPQPEIATGEEPAEASAAADGAEAGSSEKTEADTSATEGETAGVPENEEASAETQAENTEAPAEPDAADKEAAEGEQVKEYVPEHKPAAEPVLPYVDAAPDRTAFSSQTVPNFVYGKNLDRERDLAEEIRQRRRRPLIIMALLCSILVLTAVAVNTYQKLSNPAEPAATQELYIAIETPVIEITPLPVTEPEVTETPAPAVEHSYQVFTEDVSWTEARDKCEALGGHLVTISNANEYQQVVSLIESSTAATKVWIGCHREDGTLVWENGEDISYYVWGNGEPSEYDWGDNIAEDYVLMWYHNYGWYYNDSRDDPVADYPNMYSGQLAYVCEFGE